MVILTEMKNTSIAFMDWGTKYFTIFELDSGGLIEDLSIYSENLEEYKK